MSFEVVQVQDSRDLFFGLILGIDSIGYKSFPYDARLQKTLNEIYSIPPVMVRNATKYFLEIRDPSHKIDESHVDWLLSEAQKKGLIHPILNNLGWVRLNRPLQNYAEQVIHLNGNLPAFQDLGQIFLSKIERDVGH